MSNQVHLSDVDTDEDVMVISLDEKKVYDSTRYIPDTNQRIDKFIELVQNGDTGIINKFFVNNIHSSSLDFVRYMIDNGANPRYNNDQAFIRACMYGSSEVIYCLVNEYGIDVNTNNSKALRYIIQRPWEYYTPHRGDKLSAISLMKFILDNGCIITDETIEYCIYNDIGIDIMKILVEYGVEIERIGQIFWKKYIEDCSFIVNNISYMSKLGLDLNQSIENFYQNINNK